MHRAASWGFGARATVVAASGALGAAAPTRGAVDDQQHQQQQQEQADVRAELERLRDRVRQLEQREARATVEGKTSQAVLADADARSRLLQATGPAKPAAGYDKGFFLRSDDGNFLLKPGLQFQPRYILNANDTGDEEDGTEVDSGFEVRRARFRFDGHAFSPKFTYSFVFDTNRVGGGVSLLDAWVQYRLADEWAVRLGQFKEQVGQERNLSGFAQLAVDRSLVDTLIGGNLTDRVQGVALTYGGTKDNPFKAEVAFHDGANTKNTDFRDTPLGYWGAGARVEYRALGDWAAYRDFTAKGTKEKLLVLGGGVDFTDLPGAGRAIFVGDAQLELADSLAVYTALHGLWTDDRDAGDDTTDYGGVVQVGYLLTPKLEPFARYDFVTFDTDDDDTYSEFAVGANYYLGRDGAYLHRAKFTVDALFLPDGAPNNQTGIGVLAGDDAQFVVRGQLTFQL